MTELIAALEIAPAVLCSVRWPLIETAQKRFSRWKWGESWRHHRSADCTTRYERRAAWATSLILI